jgi:hypothetical protein
MPEQQQNITNIPSNRVEIIDPRTGMVSREWYRFFLNLFTLAGNGGNQTSLDDLQVGPPPSADTDSGGGGGSGTVTSVSMSVPTGLSVSGNPITSAGTLAVSYSAGYAIPTTAKQAEWDTAYADRLKWDGGATDLVAATGRTSLGSTTVGDNFFTLPNPSAITFVQINADNSITTMDAPTFRTAIGAGTGGGSVTSVGTAGTVNGLTLTGGPITTTGTITLGGTLDLSSPPTIGNTTPNTGTFTTLTATGQTSLGGAAGSESLRVVTVASAVNRLQAQGGVAGNTNFPRFLTEGSDANIFMNLLAKGASGIRSFVNGAEQMRVAHTASAVNFVQVTGAATGGPPVISAQGSDATVALLFVAKGGQDHRFFSNSGNAEQFRVIHTAGTMANHGYATGAATGSAPVFGVRGSDTNIDLALTPKGTGKVRFGTYTADMTLIVQGYIEVKDSGGTIRKLAVIA